MISALGKKICFFWKGKNAGFCRLNFRGNVFRKYVRDYAILYPEFFFQINRYIRWIVQFCKVFSPFWYDIGCNLEMVGIVILYLIYKKIFILYLECNRLFQHSSSYKDKTTINGKTSRMTIICILRQRRITHKTSSAMKMMYGGSRGESGEIIVYFKW